MRMISCSMIGRRHGDVAEREAGRLSHRAQVLVVGDHRDEFGAEAARAPAEDQVVEAMAEPGHHDENPLRLVPGDLIGHGELAGHRAEGRRQAVSVDVLGAGERGPQEQLPADGVVELLMLDDVAALLEQERADRGDDARTFLAAQREGERVGHGCLLSTRRC
jgi:hypothetical protein